MNTTKTSPVATVRLKKIVNATVARAYRAWTEPEQMIKWFGCDQVTDVKVQQDFKVGGKYHIQMICGDITMHVTGTYEEIVANKKLSYTWTSDFPDVATTDSLVSVQFVDLGDKTEIILDHSKFATEKAAQGHTEGWTFALGTLEKLLLCEDK